MRLILIAALLFESFGANPDFGSISQFIGATLLSYLAGRMMLISDFQRASGDPDLLCALLIWIIPIMSVLTLMLNGNFQKTPYTLALFITVCSIRVIVSKLGLVTLTVNYVIVGIIFTMISFAFESNQLQDALSLISTVTGRVRYSPFESHPNLVGHIYALLCLVTFCIIRYSSTRGRPKAMLILFLVLFSICLIATSSRGALAGLIFSAIVGTGLIEIIQHKSSRLLVFAIAGVSITIAGAIAFGHGFSLTNNYVGDILELDSQDRGLNSGMTGRADNWPYIISQTASSPRSLLVGNGYRSWDNEGTGVETDSSYVNIFWESGLIGIVSLTVLIILKIRSATLWNNSLEGKLTIFILLFGLVESIVARYLVGIGNPASILMLAAMLTGSSSVAGPNLIRRFS